MKMKTLLDEITLREMMRKADEYRQKSNDNYEPAAQTGPGLMGPMLGSLVDLEERISWDPVLRSLVDLEEGTSFDPAVLKKITIERKV